MKHTCHHPRCERQVPPELLACKSHWFALPARIRHGIASTYQPGQCNLNPHPSVDWMEWAFRARLYWNGESDWETRPYWYRAKWEELRGGSQEAAP